MKKIYLPNITLLIFLFLLITVPRLKAGERKKIASVTNKNTVQPAKATMKCARKNDDMGNCLSCHDKNGWLDMKYIHGPLAINDCRPCHIKPGKKITEKAGIDFRKNPCAFCHQEDELKKVHPEKLKKGSPACLTCHNPHASDKEYFLR